LGKGYKRKNVYFTFVMESELVSDRIDLFSEKGEKRKSVYLTFVTARRRSESDKTEVRESRKRRGTG
jgi:hypothetical protein